MAEYIEREAACANRITIQTKEYGSIEIVPADVIADIPAADVRTVVRCKDCRYYNKQYFVTGKCYGTFCDILRRDYGKDFFCGMGEKREVEHEL